MAKERLAGEKLLTRGAAVKADDPVRQQKAIELFDQLSKNPDKL